MSSFYTNFHTYKNHILVRGYDNGKRFAKRVIYQPYLFAADPKGTYTTLMDNNKAKKIQFDSIYKARQFYRDNKNIAGLNLYGQEKFEYVYINDTYKGPIDYVRSWINVGDLDIEVLSDEGFPHADVADKPITAITVEVNGIYHVFGCKEFKTNNPAIKYNRCKHEKDLIYKFIKKWIELDLDVVTGWYVASFDIPYLVNRITKLFGEEVTKLLSPWKIIEKREFAGAYGKQMVEYKIVGLSVLDYLQLYKKFTYIQQARYSLDHIANVEIGEGKIDYSEYANLHTLYARNYQKFIEYNIRDVGLVKRLDDKLKLIDLAFAVAYDSHVNFEDVFTSVKPWDVIISNHLFNTRNVVIPQARESFGGGMDRVPGAFVKMPLPGLFKWIVSIDAASEYPSTMMQWNISPETFVRKLDNFPTVDEIVATESVPYNLIDYKDDYCVAGNGCLYRKDKQGVIGELMEKMFADRVAYKKKMIALKNEDEKNPSQALKNEISKYDNLQQAKKIQLNSCYGAQANDGFRYKSDDNAAAVTTTGQLIVKWAEKVTNKYLNRLLKTDNVDYVIAIDTDSLYFTVDKVVEKVFENKQPTNEQILDFINKFCDEKLVPYINKSFKRLAAITNAFYNDKIVMKREVIGNIGFWVAKKRYAINVLDNEHVRYAKPKVKIMGGEAIKSSTPESCRTSIKEAMEIILNKDQKALLEFINQYKEKFLNELSFNDIAFPRGINDLEKYNDRSTIYKKGTPIHVKGALLYNHWLKKLDLEKKYPDIKDNDKLLYCYLKKPNPIQNTVISVPYILPPEMKLEEYLDKQTQFEKAFLEPLRNITQSIGWSIEKRNTISQFMKKKDHNELTNTTTD